MRSIEPAGGSPDHVDGSSPVFIGGFRSGTTLLSNYLGLHPRLSAIYETKYLVELLRVVRLLDGEAGRSEPELAFLRWRADRSDVTHTEALDLALDRALADIDLTQQALDGRIPDGKARYERYALGTNHILWTASEALEEIGPFVQAVRSGAAPATLYPALAAAMRSLFDRHASREGKREWVNKTPEILRFQPELRRMLGRVRFIHLIRDGRDVVQSSTRLNWWSVEMGSRAWRMFIEEARDHASVCPNDYLEVRYEDLVSDHVGTLRQVFRFLEIDGNPEEIVAFQERLAPGSTTGQEAQARIGQWRSAMSEADRNIFKAMTNDLLISLGYAVDGAW